MLKNPERLRQSADGSIPAGTAAPRRRNRRAAIHPFPPAESAAHERLFIEELPMIRRVIASVARKYHLPADDADEFAGEVFLRLVSDNYAVLRKFQGRSSMQTFLNVVIRRIYIDCQTARWGKWRPSSASRRAGDTAVLLDRLTKRDHLTFDEAVATIEARQGTVDRDALAKTYARFRRHGRPRFVDVEGLPDTLPCDSTADERVRCVEENGVLSAALRQLESLCSHLSDSDRLLLRFHFGVGLPVSVIARRLQVNQKQLYRRLDRILVQLRKSLESRGIAGREILPCLGSNLVLPSEAAAGV
jgi:RNA polymerase sigma factor for flagellar operon FliA